VALKVYFKPINVEAEANRGDVLLDVMRAAGIRIESLCGGKGQCGKCRVIHESGDLEKISKTPDKFLSQVELDEGYYLACMVRVLSDCVFTIPTESRIDRPKILISTSLVQEEKDPSTRKYLVDSSPFVDTDLLIPRKRIRLMDYTGMQPRMGDEIFDKLQLLTNERLITATVSRTKGFPEIIGIEPGDRTSHNYGLAIDIGTTTIVGVLVNLSTGEIIARGSEMNRQITYGEELITRISFSREPEGLDKLQMIVVDTINDVIQAMASESGIAPEDITDVCAGGNTVMNHLFTAIDPTYLEMANVEVSRDPIIRRAGELGLQVNPRAYVYCLPNVSRFLGGDAVGDIIASNMHKQEEMSLMVDLGTNGEVIFGNSDWLFSSSCASGPAFEGEGVRHGMRGARGGIGTG
jgi:uncharacterized 2Fe-2S/4Fe-4S cluster protein (DUF4445 family)